MPIETNFKFGQVVNPPALGWPLVWLRRPIHAVFSLGSSAICRWRSRARTTPSGVGRDKASI